MWAVVAALPLALLPVRNLGLLLLLAVAADLAIVVAIVRVVSARRTRATEAEIVSLDGTGPVALRRRTEPKMRGRRPESVVEMQVRWRQAAEAHRRARHGL